MTSQHDKAKRWRPRFSVSTLVVLVTLVCAYLGCWSATKRYGVEDVVAKSLLRMDGRPLAFHRWYLPSTAKVYAPFVVVTDPNGSPPEIHLWFFGYVTKWPPEREI